MAEFKHVSVLAPECIEGLCIDPSGIYVDGTVGGGGHSALIAEKLRSPGRLICIDRDEEALEAAEKRLAEFEAHITFVRDNFFNLRSILDSLIIGKISGCLLDLGVSSRHLDEPSRGFSFLNEGSLDMRMDRRGSLTAFDVINSYDEERLKKIFADYGEERYAGRVARAVAIARADKPIMGTLELAEIVSKAIPRGSWEPNKHPATRVFQALRIEVNSELEGLGQALEDAALNLRPGGRLCVITFHSLEDRIAKTLFKNLASGCDCSKNMPYCVCGKVPAAKIITKKPIIPAAAEVLENPRARSAKLRILEKI